MGPQVCKTGGKNVAIPPPPQKKNNNHLHGLKNPNFEITPFRSHRLCIIIK